MNKFLLSTLIITMVTTLPIHAGSVTPYSGSRIFWDTATQNTVFQSGGYARMIQLKDKRLMAVTENNGIDITFSSNLGSSWLSPTKLVANLPGIPECVPDLIQLADGTIIVAYNPRPSSPFSADQKFGIRCKRSIDNGLTWSDEILVYDGGWDWGTGVWEPSMLQLPSGELQLYFADESAYPTNNDQQISMCRSFDGGQTWSAPIKTSYRQGSRDGMPTAGILHDGATIATAFEDNGWAGVGDFIPTIGVCPLATNWHNYWISASSPNRWKACDYNYVPTDVKGGAPYLRVLPWGETVISHQSTYGDGANQMYIYVGDQNAKGFKAMSAPFSLGATESAMWNSLAVIDTGIVVAVAPISGRVQMIKGYPVNTLNANYAHPTIDGTQTVGEGYFKANATQMILGRQQGTRFTGDFAFDKDSLYFTSRVSDLDQVAIGGSYGDGVTLLLDARNVSQDKPATGVYRLFFRLDGTMQVMNGLDGSSSWQVHPVGDTLNIDYKVKRTTRYYVVEAAIPWSSLSFDSTPSNTDMRVNVMLQNRASTSSIPVFEMLPDSKRDESWSWMKLRIGDISLTKVDHPTASSDQSYLIKRNGNNLEADPLNCSSITLFSPSGVIIAQSKEAKIQLPTTRGIFIVRVELNDGKEYISKIQN